MLDIGNSEDWLALHISFAPCLIGYGEIARRLYHDPRTKRENNPYWKWVLNYVADDYSLAVKTGRGESNPQRPAIIQLIKVSELLEKHAVRQSPYRLFELLQIFIRATKVRHQKCFSRRVR